MVLLICIFFFCNVYMCNLFYFLNSFILWLMFIADDEANSVMLDSIVNFLAVGLQSGKRILYLYYTWYISSICLYFISVYLCRDNSHITSFYSVHLGCSILCSFCLCWYKLSHELNITPDVIYMLLVVVWILLLPYCNFLLDYIYVIPVKCHVCHVYIMTCIQPLFCMFDVTILSGCVSNCPVFTTDIKINIHTHLPAWALPKIIYNLSFYFK